MERDKRDTVPDLEPAALFDCACAASRPVESGLDGRTRNSASAPKRSDDPEVALHMPCSGKRRIGSPRELGGGELRLCLEHCPAVGAIGCPHHHPVAVSPVASRERLGRRDVAGAIAQQVRRDAKTGTLEPRILAVSADLELGPCGEQVKTRSPVVSSEAGVAAVPALPAGERGPQGAGTL
jgi:hypothetical protein